MVELLLILKCQLFFDVKKTQKKLNKADHGNQTHSSTTYRPTRGNHGTMLIHGSSIHEGRSVSPLHYIGVFFTWSTAFASRPPPVDAAPIGRSSPLEQRLPIVADLLSSFLKHKIGEMLFDVYDLSPTV